MGQQQLEFGEGRVWSFTASVNVTSGILVKLDAAGLGTVRPCTAASEACLGISLIPASAGKQVSVGIEGIYNVWVSSAAVIAGDLLGTFTGGSARERAFGVENDRRSYDVGLALEAIANGARGKVKLYW